MRLRHFCDNPQKRNIWYFLKSSVTTPWHFTVFFKETFFYTCSSKINLQKYHKIALVNLLIFFYFWQNVTKYFHKSCDWMTQLFIHLQPLYIKSSQNFVKYLKYILHIFFTQKNYNLHVLSPNSIDFTEFLQKKKKPCESRFCIFKTVPCTFDKAGVEITKYLFSYFLTKIAWNQLTETIVLFSRNSLFR